MVIDTSAIIAILLGESEAQNFVEAIMNDSKRLLSAVPGLETAIVIEARKGMLGSQQLDLLLYRAGIDIVSMNSEQVQIARNS